MVEILQTALMITGFVLAMMLLVEYLNVLTAGRWHRSLAGRRWSQYLLGAVLGVTPGCLGAFAAVALYTHGVLTLGAVVTAMIASTGDEAFVMLAIIPKQALLLMAVLGLCGIVVGASVDAISGRRKTAVPDACMEVHPQERCQCWPAGRIVSQWQECSAARGTLAVALALFATGVLAGRLGGHESGWIRATLLVVSGMALFITCTVPDHFLEQHLWRHVALKHAPRVFLWTLLALLVVHLITDVWHVEKAVRSSPRIVLLLACLVGLIPESGPHLIFVTLFAQGLVPFSVLLASSVVQDGHGMLPMLAHSVREFFIVKAINFAAGLVLGAVLMSFGW